MDMCSLRLLFCRLTCVLCAILQMDVCRSTDTVKSPLSVEYGICRHYLLNAGYGAGRHVVFFNRRGGITNCYYTLAICS